MKTDIVIITTHTAIILWILEAGLQQFYSV